MGEDDRPPLSRRVPNENRGHKPAARVGVRQLPDEVVARMRAAVEAGAAAEARDAEALGDRAAALGVLTPPSGVPIAEPKSPGPESAARNSHKGPSARGARKRADHAARQAEAQQGPTADPASASGPGEAEKPLPRRVRKARPGVAPAAQQEQASQRPMPGGLEPGLSPDADTEQFAAIPPVTAVGDLIAAPVHEPPAPEAPAAARPAPEEPPLPASTIAAVPAGRAKAAAAGRRYRVVGAAAAIAALVLAGSLTLLFRGAPPSARPPVAVDRGAATRSNAAAWIATQVSPTVLISCDPAMCQALAADGFPPDDTRALSQGGSPLGSTLVVATATVRQQLGSRLAAADAPAVMASFGTGGSRVDVRLVAQNGAAAYQSAMSADLAQRKQAGTEFLISNRVGISNRAFAPISAGHVDPRLLIMLTDLEVERPIQVVSFGDAGPGASLNVSPYRAAVFEQVPDGPHLPGAKFAAAMLSYLKAQRLPQFKVASAERLRLPGGQVGVRIEFSEPEPLGLLNGGG